MSDDLIKVRLVSPAKVGGRWLKQGDEHVSAEEMAALHAVGLLEAAGADVVIVETGEGDVPRTFTVAEWEASVAAEAHKLAGQAFDSALARIEADMQAIIADCEKLTAEKLAAEEGVSTLSARVEDLLQTLDAERQKSAVLDEKLTAAQAEITVLKATPATAKTNTPPSEKAAKTAPKKGAAATTG